MSKHRQLLIAFLAGSAIAWAIGALYRSADLPRAPLLLDRAAAADAEPKPADSPEVAAVRRTAVEFVKVFNLGDAKAVADYWTKEGEYIGPDGEAIHGRAAIAKGYTEFFKKNPKAKLEVHIDSIRLL